MSQASIEDFSKAISLDSTFHEFYFNRALSYKKNKQYELSDKIRDDLVALGYQIDD